MKAAVLTAIRALYGKKSALGGEGCNNNRQCFVSVIPGTEESVCAQ